MTPTQDPQQTTGDPEDPGLGANPLPDGRWSFRVWAPRAASLQLELLPRREGDDPRRLELHRDGDVFGVEVAGVEAGDRYFYVFADGRRRPDPRSRRQPDGVHGPSATVDLGRRRTQRFAAGPVADWVIYELHVGTFTPAGTFDGVVDKLDYLRDELGVNAIELMPVAAFAGERGWGYDGVHPFAVQESYGGPSGLSRLVHAAHTKGIALILDVVYNHLGPEGNYLREFAPYFTNKHETPWGDALNFDDVGADFVRSYFRDNALQWIRDYGFDGLRLDAVQMIQDASPRHVLAEIGEAVQAAGGALIAESDRNDPITVRPRSEGGWGHDAQWSDDLHHSLHAISSGERKGYYEDYGRASDVAAALERGFVYDGSRPSSFRGTRYGKSTSGIPAERHVVCLQNHDQIGNRARGDRIAALVGIQAAKVGAAVVLLCPEVPLLFMGEEFAATQPFPYFTSHGDPGVARSVTEGRRHEFSAFEWQGEVPDPQAEATFERAILQWDDRLRDPHAEVLAFYREAISLRRHHPALAGPDRRERLLVRAFDPQEAVTMERWSEDGSARLLAIFAFSRRPQRLPFQPTPGRWRRILHTGPEEKAPRKELIVGADGWAEMELLPLMAKVYEHG